MHLTKVSADYSQPLVIPNAMTIVAAERHELHEKIVHLRALREAAEADNDTSLRTGKHSG